MKRFLFVAALAVVIFIACTPTPTPLPTPLPTQTPVPPTTAPTQVPATAMATAEPVVSPTPPTATPTPTLAPSYLLVHVVADPNMWVIDGSIVRVHVANPSPWWTAENNDMALQWTVSVDGKTSTIVRSGQYWDWPTVVPAGAKIRVELRLPNGEIISGQDW